MLEQKGFGMRSFFRAFKNYSKQQIITLSLKKVVYVALSNLNQLNELAEKAGTIAAAEEVDKIVSEHIDYDISTNGFIEDIDAIEKVNTNRIENKELEDEHIKWLEKELALLNEEFSRRTGISITSQDTGEG